MTTLEARIAEVLGAHGYRIEHDAAGSGLATIVCVCGNRYGLGATHLAHQASMLAPVITSSNAKAWHEGFNDGKRQDAEGDDGPRFTNPYRSNDE